MTVRPPAASVLIPVKGLDHAKSRLSLLGGQTRRDLAVAFAVDTASIALATPGAGPVIIVSGDPAVRAAMPQGVRFAPDAGRLNLSLAQAAEAERSRDPKVRVLALCSDLPALRGEELAALLRCPEDRVAVADRSGTGTTALLAGTTLVPCFGEGSFSRHLASGAVAYGAAAPGLRCDVDTVADLEQARQLGLGPATSLADARRPGPSGPGPSEGGSL